MKSLPWQTSGAILAGALLISGCGGGNSGSTDNTASGGDRASNATTNTTSTSSAGNSGGSTKLTGAGSTFIYPLMSKWVDSYKQKNGVEINYQSIGSGAGIKQLKGNTVDFGATDVPLDDKAAKEMPSEVVQIPMTAGAVAIVYNVPGADSLKLSGPVLADIFQGNITRWNDPKIAALNAGAKLPATAITVAHRSDGSGTTNIFTSYLKAVSPTWATKVGAGKSVAWPVGNGGKGNDGVASTVQGTAGAIGYVELAYANNPKHKMSYALVQNAAGQYVAPSADGAAAAVADAAGALAKDIRTPIVNGKGAQTYPISGMTYLLIYKKQGDANKSKSLTGFVKWALADGQAMSKSLDYAPLPPALVKLDQAAIGGVS